MTATHTDTTQGCHCTVDNTQHFYSVCVPCQVTMRSPAILMFPGSLPNLHAKSSIVPSNRSLPRH